MSARWIFGRMSPAGSAARLTVLIFHRVLPVRDPLLEHEPDADWFELQMQWVKRWFNVLPLGEAVHRMRTGSLPARAAAITFDDGYADNYTIALPILRRLGLTATIFVTTGYLDGGQMWNDKVVDVIRKAKAPNLDLSSLGLGVYPVETIEARQRSRDRLLGDLKYMEPSKRLRLTDQVAALADVKTSGGLMLTSGQVRLLAEAGMTIGAHTVSHPILARVDERQARSEMIQSKERLEFLLGSKIDLFAYPNGKPGTDYTALHAQLARLAGFSAAVSTGWGAASSSSDQFQIPRFTPWDRTGLRYALRLARNLRRNVVVAH